MTALTKITTGANNAGIPISKDPYNDLVTHMEALEAAVDVLEKSHQSHPRSAIYFRPTAHEMSGHAASVAKYSAVVTSEASYIPTLKALNPDIICLYDWNIPDGSWYPLETAFNKRFFGASPQWILTQVGTTLTADVDASVTTIPVTATTSGGIELFANTDLLLCGNELMQMDSKSGLNLTVHRGVTGMAPFAATAHTSGDRIAAVYAGSPGTTAVVMDVTADCPSVDVGGPKGAETWNEYTARIVIEEIQANGWDGMFLDNSWIDGALYIRWTGRSRSVAWPDRTDTISTDYYDAFDIAWKLGIRTQLDLIRAGIGDKYLFCNALADDYYYDIVNGVLMETVYELTTTAADWYRATVFSQINNLSTFIPWGARGRQPRLSAAMLDYSWTSGDGYAHPRYQIGTTLLAGSSLSIRASSQPLQWFDEFDNAGVGVGYLGEPIDEAYPLVAEATDLLDGDGDFESAVHYATWSVGGDGTGSYVGNAFQVVDGGTSGGYSSQYVAHATTVEDAHVYRLTFRARATSQVFVDTGIWVSTTNRGYGNTQARVSTRWRDFVTDITTTAAGVGTVRLFWPTSWTGTIWFDDIEVREVTHQVWRRDFDHGSVFVNAEADAQVLDYDDATHPLKTLLDANFTRIHAADGLNQDPTVNDGSTVTTDITLAARDGIILLGDNR